MGHLFTYFSCCFMFLSWYQISSSIEIFWSGIVLKQKIWYCDDTTVCWRLSKVWTLVLAFDSSLEATVYSLKMSNISIFLTHTYSFALELIHQLGLYGLCHVSFVWFLKHQLLEVYPYTNWISECGCRREDTDDEK